MGLTIILTQPPLETRDIGQISSPAHTHFHRIVLASFTCDASRIPLSERIWAKKRNPKLKKGQKSRFKSAVEDPKRSNTNTTVQEVHTTVHMLHTMAHTVQRVVHMVLRADLGWIDAR
jgi:hypothetical protein